MKRKKIIYTLALLATVGCSGLGGDGKHESTLLEINTEIDTKAAAIQGASFGHEATINVILTSGTTRELFYVLKKPTDGAGAWLPSSGSGILLTSTVETVYAHYPSTLPVGSNIDKTNMVMTPAVPTTLDFGTPDSYNADNAFHILFDGINKSEVLMAEGEYDYMLGKGANTVSNTTKSVSINMKHNLAMLVIKITKAAENTSPGIIKTIAFKNTTTGSKPLKKGSFTFDDNTFTPSTEVSYTRTMDNFAEGTYFAMMVYPTVIDNNTVILELSVDKILYTIAIPANTWSSGKIVTYNILLKATEAEITGTIDVLDWDALEANNTYLFPLE